MRAELRSLDSSDAPEGLTSFSPADPERVSIAVTAMVGAVGEEGEDLFYFNVVTAAWLAEHPPTKGFEFLRELLVTRWDFAIVSRAISDLCFHTEGKDWDEIATKLSRAAYWEFEGFQE